MKLVEACDVTDGKKVGLEEHHHNAKIYMEEQFKNSHS